MAGGKKHGQDHEGGDVEASSEGPRQPTGWRDLARPGYDYPEELGELSRRDRRRAKREWRQDDQARRNEWLRARRQAEPASPVIVVAAVVLLAIVVLGVGGGLPKLLGQDDQRPPAGILTPPPATAPVVDPTADQSSQPSPTQATSALSVPPVLTEGPSQESIRIASHVTNLWAHAFYTRTPASETYPQLVAKVEQYVTPEVAESLTSGGDPTYDALRNDGGKSTVVTAPVVPPRPGSAPVDTPTRISRLVTVTIDITGANAERIVLPLLVTLVPQEGRWVISEIDGGTGP